MLQQYLIDERQLSLLCQITESEVQGWFAFLSTTPSSVDTCLSVGTIATYARSARAFCHWLVRKGYLFQMPFVKGTIPKVGKRRIGLIEADEFELLLLVCRPGETGGIAVERAATRNRALLWVLLDTGMRVSLLVLVGKKLILCTLQLSTPVAEDPQNRVNFILFCFLEWESPGVLDTRDCFWT
ncbi:MAG TPA: hypothetical protein VGN34_32020 [Ktedonobacteraceae bacterium]